MTPYEYKKPSFKTFGDITSNDTLYKVTFSNTIEELKVYRVEKSNNYGSCDYNHITIYCKTNNNNDFALSVSGGNLENTGYGKIFTTLTKAKKHQESCLRYEAMCKLREDKSKLKTKLEEIEELRRKISAMQGRLHVLENEVYEKR